MGKLLGTVGVMGVGVGITAGVKVRLPMGAILTMGVGLVLSIDLALVPGTVVELVGLMTVGVLVAVALNLIRGVSRPLMSDPVLTGADVTAATLVPVPLGLQMIASETVGRGVLGLGADLAVLRLVGLLDRLLLVPLLKILSPRNVDALGRLVVLLAADPGVLPSLVAALRLDTILGLAAVATLALVAILTVILTLVLGLGLGMVLITALGPGCPMRPGCIVPRLPLLCPPPPQDRPVFPVVPGPLLFPVRVVL